MQSGIYIIQSKLFPKRLYIGSSIDLLKRQRRHIWQLYRKRHHNAKMQHHADKYGLEDLKFEIVCYCKKKDLLKLKQDLLDVFRPYFNINPTAGNRMGSKLSAHSKTKISANSKKIHRLSFTSSLFFKQK